MSILDAKGQSDPGIVRQGEPNQDSYYSAADPAARVSQPMLNARGALFVVADGVGGHQGGSRASQLAVQVISQRYYADQNPDLVASLKGAVEEANRAIKHEAITSPNYFGMGTTATAAVVRGQELYVAHVGDSRAYRVRQGQIQRLTNDHSVAEEGFRRGLFNAQEAANHPQRNVLTRSLGAELHVDVDTWTDPHGMQNGDALLLCSDGLTNVVQDPTLAQVVVTSRKSEHAAQQLIHLAKQGGGPDNITAVVVRAGAPRVGRESTGPRPVVLPAPPVPPPAVAASPAARKTMPYWRAAIVAAVIVVALAGGIMLVTFGHLDSLWRPQVSPIPTVSSTSATPSPGPVPTGTALPRPVPGQVVPVSPPDKKTFPAGEAPAALTWATQWTAGQKFKLTLDTKEYTLNKSDLTTLGEEQFSYLNLASDLARPGAHSWKVDVLGEDGKLVATGGPWTFAVLAPIPPPLLLGPTPTSLVSTVPAPDCKGGQVISGTECVCPPDKPNWLDDMCTGKDKGDKPDAPDRPKGP